MKIEHSKILNIVFLSSLFIVFLASFFRFFYLKEFLVQIELPCDPTLEICYSRDCSIENECPPNDLSTYKIFEMVAKDFNRCDVDNNCEDMCTNANSTCKEIICDNNKYTCTSLE